MKGFMAPKKKPGATNKRLSSLKDVSFKKVEADSSKQRKKRLSDKLVPQWNEEELKKFYEAYRKFGKNWNKVAAIVSSKSVEMVEALYKMNRAYLSLPEGVASVVGLIAMMTDYYNVLDDSDSGSESNDVPASQKPIKQKRGEVQLSVSNDSVQSQSIAFSEEGNQPRAVGKRTPRIPVDYSYKNKVRENNVLPNQRNLKSDFGANDDKAAIELVRMETLALAQAAQGGGSSRVSQKPPYKRIKQKFSHVQWGQRMHQESQTVPVKFFDASIDEECLEGSIESRGAEKGEYTRATSFLSNMQGIGTVEAHQRGKKIRGKKGRVETAGNHPHGGEATTCDGKRSKKVFCGDESSSWDAFQTLVDLSLSTMKPTSTMESELSVQLKEEKMTVDKNENSALPEGTSTSQNRDRIKHRSFQRKACHVVPGVGSSTKHRSRRKTILQRSFTPKENILKSEPSKYSTPVQDKALLLKGKLSGCLSSYMVRRWCMFEWFYSAIDYPWFSTSEFTEYLNRVDLGRIPRLTRVEWSIIRGSLGKPRRFSEHFLHRERRKLKQYRESVRQYYVEMWTGIRDGLPSDLAKPLCVGQRVIVFHSKTREIHDGCVLKVHLHTYSVKFDSPELGVEVVMQTLISIYLHGACSSSSAARLATVTVSHQQDIDCMPSNPLDNMPENLKWQIGSGNVPCTSKKAPMKGNSSFGGRMTSVSSGPMEKAPSSSSALAKHKKVGLIINKKIQCAVLKSLNTVSLMQWLFPFAPLSSTLPPKEIFSGAYALPLYVSNPLLHLRQHDTYLRNSQESQPPLMNSRESFDIHDGLPNMMDRSSIGEIIKGSRLRAHAMVDAAFQAVSSTKEGENALTRIWQVLDCADYQQLATNSRLPENRSQEQTSGSFDYHNRSLEPLLIDASGQKVHNKVDTQIPLELITSCVATWIMIQACIEQQCFPADVAQILDSAVTSLCPRSPQNHTVYREIQRCLGRIKTRILALVPA
ncbi:hypothetical protein Fmac_006969 [Flemingia macrophylla]|uniref:SANT domain-containing protein n=1 Tax=Flemingia macrophylla TaxID=520843 RepID=A0ABD1NC50_9FABA